jgi:nitrate/nitrite-specific signal transduction histidine kinase
MLIILGSIGTVLWYKKRKERLQLESQNAIKESELKTSKKVHDVVANGLYRIMSEIENGGLLDQERLLDDMEHLYEQSRDISYDDKNQELLKSGFENTIKALLGAFATENTKVLILGNTSETWAGVGLKLKYELRYILQELMVNMKKHSNASAVAIRFEPLNEHLKVYYTDNGVGLPANHIYGNGLHNTENRIKSVGGSLIFAGSEEGGVKIQLLFPTV